MGTRKLRAGNHRVKPFR